MVFVWLAQSSNATTYGWLQVYIYWVVVFHIYTYEKIIPVGLSIYIGGYRILPIPIPTQVILPIREPIRLYPLENLKL
jgi:hypothetical protein